MNKIILKASAGTGKTYRLSIEFIAELLKGTAYDEILVLTFTKKATGEIRERVLEFIERIIYKNDEDLIESVEEKLGKLFDIEILKNIYVQMIKNKEALKIYTIDSFIHQIFKKVIGPNLNIYNFEIIDDQKNSEYLQRVLDEILRDKKHFAQLKEFFLDNKEKKVSSYQKFINSFINERWKLKFIQRVERPKLSYDKPHKYVTKLMGNLEELKKTKTNTMEKPLEEVIVTIFKPLLGKEDFEYIDNYIIDNMSKILETPNFFNGGKFRSAKTDKPEMQGLKDISIELFGRFKEDLNRYFYNEKIIPLEKNLFDFGDYCQEIYDKYKLQDKRFTFNDLSYYVFHYFFNETLGLVKNDKCSEYLYQILDSEIKTLFIDEFQDTSIIQWSILKVFGNSSTQLICVGDEKQSIYSWRGGEKKLFEKLEDIVQGTKESMDTCYRSYGEIIRFINTFFGTISENTEEFEWGYEPVNYLSSKEGGYVETHYISKDSKEDEEQEETESSLDRIVSILKDKITNYSKVAVLARGNKDLNNIAEILNINGIPNIQSHNLCITEHKALKGVYSLLKYLNYGEYFYLLEFLRSDLINIDSSSLKVYLQYRIPVEMYLNMGENFDFPLDKEILDFIKELKNKAIENYKMTDDKDNFYEFLINKLGLVKKYSSNSDLKNIYKFYELIKQFSSLTELIEHIEENKENESLKQVAVDELNAVTLMTIHKSKGLEFETVIYYLNHKSARNYSAINLFVENNLDFTEFPSYFYIDSKYFSVLTSLGYNFENIEKEKKESEEINAVYVALTRPKHNLYIVYEGKESIYSDALKRAMGVEEAYALDYASMGTFVETPLSEVEEVSEKEFDFIEYFDKQEFSEESLDANKFNNKEYTLEKEFKRKTGSATHFYLENILYNTETELKTAKMITTARYGNMFGEEVLAEVFKNSDIFIEKFSWVFSDKYHIQREFEIFEEIDNIKKTYRIDRLLVDKENKKIWILDYKTGGKDEEQLENYKRILEGQFGNEYKVETMFLYV
ncbi:MAG: UvrD-helicase domain-containing protein [Fusobacteriaceae bacterium]|nr:UvrD-helicase domain-containing protein [Fusobacteriaceae bacterium]